MMLKTFTKTLSMALLLSLLSCRFDDNNATDSTEKQQYKEEKNIVNIIVLKKTTFKKELVGNGKLKALEKSILKFETSEKLVDLNVKNGSWVKKKVLLQALIIKKHSKN